MKLLLKESFAIVLLSFVPSANALKVCDDARAKATTAINGQYSPVLSEVENVEKQMIEKGLDPSKFPQFDKNGNLTVVDLPSLKSELSAQRGKDVADVHSRIKSECDDKLKPIQDIVNVAKAVATLGLSEVLPKRMTNVDVSVILAGHPLGKDSALIPKAREDMLEAVGMGGKNNDAARIIRNPLQPKKWFKR